MPLLVSQKLENSILLNYSTMILHLFFVKVNLFSFINFLIVKMSKNTRSLLFIAGTYLLAFVMFFYLSFPIAHALHGWIEPLVIFYLMYLAVSLVWSYTMWTKMSCTSATYIFITFGRLYPFLFSFVRTPHDYMTPRTYASTPFISCLLLMTSSLFYKLRHPLEFLTSLDVIWETWFWGTAHCQILSHSPISQILWPMSGSMLLYLFSCSGWAPWECFFTCSFSIFSLFLCFIFYYYLAYSSSDFLSRIGS